MDATTEREITLFKKSTKVKPDAKILKEIKERIERMNRNVQQTNYVFRLRHCLRRRRRGPDRPQIRTRTIIDDVAQLSSRASKSRQ
jgi:hypothetical protein